MKKVQYSKSYSNILSIKKDFYNNNIDNLKNALKINSVYINQPLRKSCKNCGKRITKKLFHQFDVAYTICNNCNHLNGIYEDSKEFVRWLYSRNSGKNYFKQYAKDFDDRVRNIYIPKVDFLKKIIKRKIRVLDIGAGGGHFLRALEKRNVPATGFEPNKSLVSLGKRKLKKNELICEDLNKTYNNVLKDKTSNTLSMIGVLEHLNKPNHILKLFNKSKLYFLYISIPLFSLSSFLENSFNKVFPRQLSGAHTHLYTKESIYYLAKKHNLKIIGEWWFGTDFPDLYRSLINTSNTYDINKYKQHLDNKLFKVINELQHILDKNKICSEVHMVFEKK